MSIRVKVSFVLLSIILASCAATPDIHLRIPGTNMEINQPAQPGRAKNRASVSFSLDGSLTFPGGDA